MALEKFREHKFTKGTESLIGQANVIITEYLNQGYSLTLRQLYYQFVARGLLENSQKNYKRLGATMSKARLSGLTDWDALEDRTRNLVGWGRTYESVSSYINTISFDYHMDIWEGQENYVEVWVEKDALAGVVEKACSRHRAKFFACRGYTSQSEQYKAGKRFAMQRSRHGRRPFVLHLGDHDPSGIDMTRDNDDRLTMFARWGVEVRRIALNWDQVEEHNPPPNPAKETDSRHAGYVAQYGESSWELDALDPAYLNRLIQSELDELVDMDLMQSRKDDEKRGQSELITIEENYEEIRDFLVEQGYLEE